MGNAESIVMQFFESNPRDRFSRKEIIRRAVKRKIAEEDPQWADDAINALVAKNAIIIDDSGYYKLKSNDKYDNK